MRSPYPIPLLITFAPCLQSRDPARAEKTVIHDDKARRPVAGGGITLAAASCITGLLFLLALWGGGVNRSRPDVLSERRAKARRIQTSSRLTASLR